MNGTAEDKDTTREKANQDRYEQMNKETACALGGWGGVALKYTASDRSSSQSVSFSSPQESTITFPNVRCASFQIP